MLAVPASLYHCAGVVVGTCRCIRPGATVDSALMDQSLAHLPMDALGRGLGVATHDARAIRFGTNVVIALPSERKVMRVLSTDAASPAEVQAGLLDVERLSRSSRVLGPAGMHIACAGGYTATIWPMGADLDRTREHYEAYGAALRSLHARAPLPGTARLHTLGRLYARLGLLEQLGVPADDREFLRRRADSLRDAHDEMVRSGDMLLHGDAQPGNAIVADDGVRLIDLDSMRIGPWQYDLVPAAVGARRFGESDIFAAMMSGYGRDPRDWEFFSTACDLRELTATSWLGTLYNRSQAHREEFHLHIATLRGDSDDTWQHI